jgi:hypothetical protein
MIKSVVGRKSPAPVEDPAFYGRVPEKCPRCRGRLKDYNAQTVVPAAGVAIPSPGLLVHLFICDKCRLKVFAPPQA